MVRPYTAETLTLDDIALWDGPEMREQLAKSDEIRTQVMTILSTATPETIGQAKKNAAVIKAGGIVEPPVVEQPTVAAPTPEELEAQRVAAEKAEIERKAAEEAAKPKQKIVVNYQATDEEGNPIGRLNHQRPLSDSLMKSTRQQLRI